MTYWMYTPGYAVMLAIHAFAPTSKSNVADIITPIALVGLSAWSLAHNINRLLSLATAFALGVVLCTPPAAIKSHGVARALHIGKVAAPAALAGVIAVARPSLYPVAIVFAGGIALKGIVFDSIR